MEDKIEHIIRAGNSYAITIPKELKTYLGINLKTKDSIMVKKHWNEETHTLEIQFVEMKTKSIFSEKINSINLESVEDDAIRDWKRKNL